MSGKEILTSVFVSIVLISVVGFVALPAVYPSLQKSSSPTDNDTDLGKVIQMKYIESSSQAGIQDDNINSFIKVPNMEINITVSANSVLDAVFTSPYIFGVGPGSSSERYIFNVSLAIKGVGNQTIALTSWNSGTTANYYEYSSTMYIHYISPKLSVGTYTVDVFYISSFKDNTNLAYLTLSIPSVNQTRTLSVMEMR